MRKLLLVAATSFVKWEEGEVAGLLCTLGGETPLETPPRESQSPKGERGRSCKCGVEGERAAGRNVKRGGQKNGMV